MDRFKRCIIKECRDIIPQIRLDVVPNTITCSKQCAAKHKRNLQRKNDREYKRRLRKTAPANYKMA